MEYSFTKSEKYIFKTSITRVVRRKGVLTTLKRTFFDFVLPGILSTKRPIMWKSGQDIFFSNIEMMNGTDSFEEFEEMSADSVELKIEASVI